MEREGEKRSTPETESISLKLNWFGLRAGHWPDSKIPPWGLNLLGTVQKKWPEISEILQKAGKEVNPGEEKIFRSGKIEFPDGRIEDVDIKIWDRKLGVDQSVDMWVWPKDKKYYKNY